MTIIEKIEILYPDVPFMVTTGYNDAIIGVHNSTSLVYSVNKVIEMLIADGMEHEDALDYFAYNIESSCSGEYAPIYVDIL